MLRHDENQEMLNSFGLFVCLFVCLFEMFNCLISFSSNMCVSDFWSNHKYFAGIVSDRIEM